MSLPDFTTQDATTYKTNIDSSIAALSAAIIALTGGDSIKILRGGVTSGGSYYVGSGWSVEKVEGTNTGVYRITFTPLFTGVPSVVVTDKSHDQQYFLSITEVSASGFIVYSSYTGTAQADSAFDFIAIGPA